MSVCTCRWSPVNTATIDPPHIVKRDPDCPAHRREDDVDCPFCHFEPIKEGWNFCPMCGEEL
jgi:hypothetical protein